MTGTNRISFLKMNGLGNEFAVFDARVHPLRLTPNVAQRIADPTTGVGCDQVILLENSQDADVFMRIHNADGGEVDACGNAMRCVAMLMVAEKNRLQVSIETNVAVMGAVVNADAAVTVDMGAPRFRWDEIPLSEEFADTRMIELQVGPIDNPALHTPSVVNVGNPHCIFWVDDLREHDLARLGPFLENHILFPERANISLAHVTSRNAITIKVWERGAGLTRACGTAACAVAVAAVRKRLADRRVTVTLPGGDLEIYWREDDDHILMTGPVEFEYEGSVDLENFSVEKI